MIHGSISVQWIRDRRSSTSSSVHSGTFRRRTSHSRPTVKPESWILCLLRLSRPEQLKAPVRERNATMAPRAHFQMGKKLFWCEFDTLQSTRPPVGREPASETTRTKGPTHANAVGEGVIQPPEPPTGACTPLEHTYGNTEGRHKCDSHKHEEIHIQPSQQLERLKTERG